MILCRIVGQVVSTVKHDVLDKKILFVVQPLTPEGEEKGTTFLAVDSVQAGPGDKVLVCREGNSCSQILNYDNSPINAVVCGIVDRVD